MRGINEYGGDFSYELLSRSPIITKTTFSNIVSNDMSGNILEVEKYVDKECASVFDILTYTIIVTNMSNRKTGNIFFKDYISKYIKFINNTVEVNGIRKGGLNPQQGFYIGKINGNCKKIISFKSIVLANSACRVIENHANIYYYYKYDMEKFPMKISIESNRVYTSIKKAVFKQLNISNTLKAPKNLKDILKVNTNSKILSIKLIKNPINKDKNLKLCNLIIVGSIEFEINYSCRNYSRFKSVNKLDNSYNIQEDKDYRSNIKMANENIENYKNQINITPSKVKKVTKTFGFSCFICSPVGIVYEDVKSINIKTEHISINELNNGELFINTSLLLYY
ncbi:DUF11 domain-containing protein [Clostridioides sp. ES-S-0001-02]|uniref:DUF11 domain-containing protein n=1 Tax=Clostridioides sp. ES-S-0001-02 TaxID=2770770 RepID=UPI001D12E750|nr:DUF11 domain-containing protein [Clostridioides sp. ES-S-0001-02]